MGVLFIYLNNLIVIIKVMKYIKNIEDYLEVKKSKILNAGKGVFAKKKIANNTRLGEYKGKIIGINKLNDLKDTTYVFTVMKNGKPIKFINGKTFKNPKKNPLIFINGAKTTKQKKQVNVESYQYKQKIYYKSNKTINLGEELLVDYGDDYWID